MIKKLKAMMLNPGRLVVQNAVQVFGGLRKQAEIRSYPTSTIWVLFVQCG